jgi:DMSO/TMAO reductase YedYZ molybdopterin-dependent catalytic subunit
VERVRNRRPVVPRRQIAPEYADRVPPGQVIAQRWPVLHHGDVPAFDPATWDLRISGLVRKPVRLSWDEFQALPQTTVDADMHCVTRWSLLDNHWRGVPFQLLMEQAGVLPAANFVLLHGEGDYTANVPVAAVRDPAALLAVANNGEPLTPEHGFPVRAVIPSRYAWKSVKWLRGIEFLAEDRPGFWEEYGYHDNADPWREERFRDESG